MFGQIFEGDRGVGVCHRLSFGEPWEGWKDDGGTGSLTSPVVGLRLLPGAGCGQGWTPGQVDSGVHRCPLIAGGKWTVGVGSGRGARAMFKEGSGRRSLLYCVSACPVSNPAWCCYHCHLHLAPFPWWTLLAPEERLLAHPTEPPTLDCQTQLPLLGQNAAGQ